MMIKREIYLKQVRDLWNSDFIKVLVGLRRSGKTLLLRSIIDEIKNNGVSEENIFYFSFESFEHKHISSAKELDDLVLELTRGVEGKLYFLFDEIQNVESWESCINSYKVSFDCDIYITGSNSKLLSNELSTLLSGRFVRIDVYPFSFSEVLQYRREVDGWDLSSEDISNLFDEYLLWGGMPGLLSINDVNSKTNALRDIYDSIIINDVLSRYVIKDIDLFKRFSSYLMNSMSQTFSKTSITNFLKNENKRTTRGTISNFTDYLCDCLFCERVQRQDILGKNLLKTEEKYYLTDHGFHHALVDDNSNWNGRVLENIVYLELIRRNYKVKVGKIGDKEIDFICVKPDRKIYIQVAYLISSDEVVEREFGSLLRVPDKFDAYVLSMDKLDMSQDGIKHKYIIDFLLDDEI